MATRDPILQRVLELDLPPDALMSVAQVAASIGMSEEYVRQLFAEGKLSGHQHTPRQPRPGESRKTGAQRGNIVIRRDSVLMHQIGTANFCSDDLVSQFVSAFDRLPREVQFRILAMLNRNQRKSA